jgi:DNA-binding response OmpR family regulator
VSRAVSPNAHPAYSHRERAPPRATSHAPGHPLHSTQSLRASIWPEGGGSPQALSEYVGRLHQKLGDDPERPRYLESERGIGYRLKRPRTPRATP